MNRILFCSLVLIVFVLTGCNYHLGYENLPQQYSTITIPFVEGDKEGELTVEIVKTISSSGAFRYVSYGGDLILKAKLLDLSDENIGFRYYRNKKGELKDSLIPTETRLIGIVEVTVIESATNTIIRGPTLIRAYQDFDHDFYSTRHGINVFSLGQLSDIDEAQSAAKIPLNRKLAERINDYIANSW